MNSGMDDELWELEAEMHDALRREQEGEAAAILAEAKGSRTFRDALRRVPTGDVITLVTVDGVAIRGRVLGVGGDVVSLGETPDETGTARTRVSRIHDVRLDACIRLVREPEL